MDDAAVFDAPLGAKLRQLRVGHRWSLGELAEQVGSSKSHLSALETGRATEPSVSLLQRLAAFHGVSMEYLLTPSLKHPDSNEDQRFIAFYRQQPEPVRAQVRVTLQRLLATATTAPRRKARDDFAAEVAAPAGGF